MKQKINTLLVKIVKFFLRLMRIAPDERKTNSFVQFIKFGIVGVSNTIISYILNIFVLLALKSANVSWDYIVGNLVAFVLSVLWSFYWNNCFVFTIESGKRRSFWKALLKTYISYGFTGIILNNILSFIWINWIDISKYIAPLINLFISIPLNFIINKLWAFKSEAINEMKKMK